MLNAIKGTQVELFYWREDNREVDFILKKGDNITALEIKSGNEGISSCGLDTFVKKFEPKTTLLVGSQGLPLEEFFTTPISGLV